jgi:polyisoprenoid-binding protein YceI
VNAAPLEGVTPVMDTAHNDHRNRSKWVKRIVIATIAGVVLFFGAILLYAKVLNDSPDEFTAADIDAALSSEANQSATTTPTEPAVTVAPTTAATESAATTAAPTPVAPSSTPAPAPAPVVAGGASAWSITDASQVGYRVEEILFGVDTTAVGRTNQVTGSMTIEGTQVTAADFTVDVASITSDESRRDAQFSGRIMSADQFPTATFVLTQPIELGADPGDGVELNASASGELTLRGVTNPVSFDVTAKQTGGLIGVQGSIPVTFADYQIANPSFGGITTEDVGLVEFVLVFAPA